VGAPRRWLCLCNVRTPNRATAVLCRSDRGGNSGGASGQGRTVHRTDLVVKADSRYEQLGDTFGGRIGCSRVTCTLSSSVQTARALLFGGRSNTRRSVPALASRELVQFARERPFLIGSESLPSKARRRSIPSFRLAH
jgi:hypothetical protein